MATSDHQNAATKIIAALDVSDIAQARALVKQLNGEISFFKIGYELLFCGGVDLAQELVAQNYRVFLDTKFYDIGRTVACGAYSLAKIGADFLTVHADRRAIEAAKSHAGTTKILAISVLTSHTEQDLRDHGIDRSMHDTLVHRAQMAVDAGADGLICAPPDLAILRDIVPEDCLLVTPGIRITSSQNLPDDQNRISSPAQALRSGADYLVIGRPITQAQDPRGAAQEIIASLDS
ncbi:MAG: orotidine-5'-phosphate decarboxylase [Pseudomonadota bacterium]